MAQLKICLKCHVLGIEQYTFCCRCLLKDGEVVAFVTSELMEKIIKICESKKFYDKADFYQGLLNKMNEQLEDGRTIV